MAKYLINEERIRNICEACYLAITTEEIRVYEDNRPPMTDFQRKLIYDRYYDLVVLAAPSEMWEKVGVVFDKTYKEVVEYHKYDAMAFA